MRLRFIQNASLQLAQADGRIVTVAHRQGEDVELGDEIAQLFLAQGLAVKVEKAKRATRPRGETR